jgi:hypothetical protein
MKIQDMPERLFLDLAIGVSTFDEVCAVYGVDPEWLREQADDPLFQRRVAIAKQAVEDDGRAFKARCRTVASDLLPHVIQLMKDPDTAASVQLDAFKTLAKLGDLEPVKADPRSAGGGTVLNLTIIGPEGQTVSPMAIPSAERVDDLPLTRAPVRGFFVAVAEPA